MTNLKAVIPVAGLGMHMLPATKAIPKEMLPIVDKPMIQYIVDEIVAAGIKEILLVTHASKNAVENHFDTSYELESLLEQRVKRQLLAEVQSICPPGVTIMNVRQGEPLGLGHSILCARPAIGDNPFSFRSRNCPQSSALRQLLVFLPTQQWHQSTEYVPMLQVEYAPVQAKYRQKAHNALQP